MEISSEFQNALDKQNIRLPDAQTQQLQRYCQAHWNWNTRLNLTRHTDFESFVTRDLLDSLKLAHYIPARETILDVGSGGGVPGAVLAIVRPDLNITMCESVVKKSKALQGIVKAANINASVYSGRAEALLKAKRFPTITARAVAPLRKLLFWLRPVAGAFDQILLIKGPRWTEERLVAEEEGLLSHLDLNLLEEYPTEGRDGNSVVLSLRPCSVG